MSQKAAILEHLERGGELTPLDALNLFGCFRLGARIMELRREGHNILDLGHERGVNHAVYRLAPAAPPRIAPWHLHPTMPGSLFPVGPVRHDKS